MTPATPARLMIASTDQADMLYVAGIQVPDPYPLNLPRTAKRDSPQAVALR